MTSAVMSGKYFTEVPPGYGSGLTSGLLLLWKSVITMSVKPQVHNSSLSAAMLVYVGAYLLPYGWRAMRSKLAAIPEFS